MSQSPEQLAELLQGALSIDEQNATLPPLETMYERILFHWGGVDAFAKDVVQTCQALSNKPQSKARFIEQVLDGLKVLKGFGLLGSPVEAEALDDAELEAEIHRESLRAAKIVHEAQDDGLSRGN